VFDMGQNFSGWVRVKTSGPKNTIVKIRFAEDIHPDGTIDVASNENAKATAEYILKGAGIETYETHFSFFGFKYVEITTENGSPNILNVEGRAVYSGNKPAGSFECDDELVNKIHRATVWSQKSNMLGYPMDCPQRDERLGWFGDAQVTADEAMFNFNMALFYKNWLDGIRQNQDEKTGDIPIISPRPYIKDEGIEWSSTYLVMLWKYYVNYGDKRILAENYQAMKRYMNFLDSLATDLILPSGWIGDWGSMVKDWKEGDPKSVPTAYYFWNAKIMSKVAAILKNNADEMHFRKLAEDVREKYNAKFMDTGTANYEDGSQMANAFPLYLGIVPENLESRVLNNLVKDIVVNNNNHLTTGVLGTKYMPEALAQLGRADVAWAIINQKSAPSWNTMVQLYTTMCEFWTLKQSKNHVMMGSIDAWFYRHIAGIQPDEKNPAYASFEVKPQILDSLGSAKSRIETMRGTISSEWKNDNGQFTLKIEVPFNTTATVYIPGKENEEITEGKVPISQVKGIENLGYKNDAYLIKVHSGNYVFTTHKNK
jgi:alpha-L-rhamnosidase